MTDSYNRAVGSGANELDPVDREAFAWVVRLSSGAATTADVEALRQWQGRSSAHADAFARALKIRRQLDQAAREFVADRSGVSQSPQLQPRMPRSLGRRAFLGGALAASAAGIMVARPPFGIWPSFAELTADYRTATGEQRHVALADGVSLQMNTQTSIVKHSDVQGGALELISGEAEISVNRAGSRTLTVAAAEGRLVTSQGRFIVRHDGASVCVTCSDGSVDVEHLREAVRLQNGQQVTYATNGLGQVVSVDTSLTGAWKNGLLVFQDRPLWQVIDEVNRYRPGKIILTNTELSRIPVNGVFHLQRIEGVIDQMQALGAHATRLPGGVVLLS